MNDDNEKRLADLREQLPARTHRSVVLDDEPPVLAPEPAEPPRRRRGRPPGAKSKVAHAPVTVDDIAFLRAVLQGVDHRAAAAHYLGHLGAPLERKAAGLYPEILRKRLVASAHALPEAREHIELLWPPGLPSPFAAQQAEVPPPEIEPEATVDPGLPAGNTLFSWNTADSSGPGPGASAPPAAPAGPPTLEEFAARFDADMFSEAELIELYQDEYEQLPLVQEVPQVPAAPAHSGPATAADVGSDASWVQQALAPPPLVMDEDEDNTSPQAREAARQMQERLQALSWIADRLAVAPKREDPIHQWLRLSTGQTYAFGQHGVLTLGSLIDWIALTGRRWYAHIPRYGRERARRLEGWIWASGMQASPGLRTPGQDMERLRASFGAGAVVAQAPAPGQLVPLAQFNWPVQHRGGAGGFRGSDRNTLEAHDDVEAVRAWFGTLNEHSPQTQRAYRGAIERLVLWAVTERRKALSALSTLDLQDFRAFLQNPPAHWVQQAPRLKTAHDWRPLRGPLKAASLQLSQAAVRALYKAWFRSGYITSDPCALLPAPKRSEVKLDVGRSFTEQDRELIRERLHALPESMAKRRLVAILVLLQTSGMRRNELSEATWTMIENMRIGDAMTAKRAIRIVGKGRRERVVPLLDSVLELLERHRQDRLQLAEQGVLRFAGKPVPDEMPLIGILDDRFAFAKTPAGGPTMAHEAPRPFNATGRLSAGRIYTLVKRFFEDCARYAGNEHSEFTSASTHWLRHTFGHQALQAAQGDLVVVKDLLGHADIGTTTIYTKSELGGRAAVVEAIEPMA